MCCLYSVDVKNLRRELISRKVHILSTNETSVRVLLILLTTASGQLPRKAWRAAAGDARGPRHRTERTLPLHESSVSCFIVMDMASMQTLSMLCASSKTTMHSFANVLEIRLAIFGSSRYP